MPAGLALCHCPTVAWPPTPALWSDPSRPTVALALQAARHHIRTAGYTLAAAWAAHCADEDFFQHDGPSISSHTGPYGSISAAAAWRHARTVAHRILRNTTTPPSASFTLVLATWQLQPRSRWQPPRPAGYAVRMPDWSALPQRAGG